LYVAPINNIHSNNNAAADDDDEEENDTTTDNNNHRQNHNDTGTNQHNDDKNNNTNHVMNFHDLMSEYHGDSDSHICHPGKNPYSSAVRPAKRYSGALEEDHPSEGAERIDELSLYCCISNIYI
jgi:hypothetical protein